MKINKKKVVLIIMISTYLLTSVQVSSQDLEKSKKDKSIALISTIIGKIPLSPIPLLDAPPFNKKVNSIAPLIIKEEQNVINTYRENIASSLKKYFNCEILYGDSLISKPSYKEISKKFNYPDNLKIEDVYFPKLIIPEDEVNVFMFENGTKVQNFLKNEMNTKQTVSEICKTLETDYVAVSYSFMFIYGYRPLGKYAELCLATEIYIFDKDGKLAGKSTWTSKKEWMKVSGDDIAEYKAVLALFPGVVDNMMVRVAKKVPIK